MTNLIFDLNNIAHRSMFIVSGYGKTTFTFDSQSEIDQLIRKMSMDVTHIIRQINPSRVIFAVDSKSWRTDIKIEENEGYKGNRTKSSFINWNNVYKALDEFTEIVENYGMIVTKIQRAEADDIISLWSYELAINQNQHVIIVSGDEDLRQLIKFNPYDAANKKFAFVTVFNPFLQGKNASKKLYVPKYFEEWLNTVEAVDIFNMKGSINVDKEDFKKIINSEKTKLETVDGRLIALRKIFCGDDGDNIPAIYSWLNEKGVEVRITNSKFEKIYDSIVESPDELMDHYDLLERSDKILEILKKITKQNISFDIESRLKRQIKLVVLDYIFFPEEIVETFEKNKNKELEKIRVNYGNLNMYNLLEGTNYIKERKNENVSSIFKDIDRINKTSLF